MKGTLKFMAIVIGALTFAACNREADAIEQVIAGFTTCYTNDKGQIEILADDMGSRYMVEDNDYKFSAGDELRMVCTYSIGENDIVTVHQAITPITKKLVHIAGIKPEAVVWDPFQVRSAYIGSGCLNMMLDIKVQNEKSVHTITPVLMENSDSIVISFIHDTGGETPVYTKTAFASISLVGTGLHKNDTVFFKYRSYNEEDCMLKLPYR